MTHPESSLDEWLRKNITGPVGWEWYLWEVEKSKE